MSNHLDQMAHTLSLDNPAPTTADLIAAFGPPEALAAELLEQCPEGEVAQVRKHRVWVWRGLAAALVLITVSSCVYGYYMRQTKGGRVEIITRIYETGPHPSFWDDMENEEGRIRYQIKED